jgi:hypothetical protein
MLTTYDPATNTSPVLKLPSGPVAPTQPEAPPGKGPLMLT